MGVLPHVRARLLSGDWHGHLVLGFCRVNPYLPRIARFSMRTAITRRVSVKRGLHHKFTVSLVHVGFLKISVLFLLRKLQNKPTKNAEWCRKPAYDYLHPSALPSICVAILLVLHRSK